MYIVWPGGHGMVYDNAWRGMAWHVEVLFTLTGPVHKQRDCYMHTLGSDSTLRDCGYMFHCTGIELSPVTVSLCRRRPRFL